MRSMKKNNLLSPELSKAKALVYSACSAQMILVLFQNWKMQRTIFGQNVVLKSLHRWNQLLIDVIQESIVLGAPLTEMLQEMHSIVRAEEKLWMKLKLVEQQMAFQGAIVFVLPWFASAFSGKLEWNFWVAIGLFLQALGLLGFYHAFSSLISKKQTETRWVFNLVIAIQSRVLSGQTLFLAFQSALQKMDPDPLLLKQAWNDWFEAHRNGSLIHHSYAWKKFSLSKDFSSLLAVLLRNGAQASQTLKEFALQYADEIHYQIEEKILFLPTKVSLLFCLFFAPAFFFILIGSLWTNLKNLWM